MSDTKHALVIGSNGAIGSALAQQLSAAYEVHTINRSNCDYSESALAEHYQRLAQYGVFQRIICTIGVLQQGDELSPEKSLKQVTEQSLLAYFLHNSILPTLCLKHFYSLLPKQQSAVYASLSAMVGSIADNRLGGWYGYRSSKTALNMLIKTSSVEIARVRKQAAIIAIHPGTTVSDLSSPFARNVSADKYYTPEQSAGRILDVMDTVTATDTGGFFNWNGERLPW